MKILQARFVKGIVQDDTVMEDGVPHIAFIGRSNVGKSSLINALTNQKVSRTSAQAGSTREINFFLINNDTYFVDLPGYGYARASHETKEKLKNLINSYLFNTVYTQKKVVLIIDCKVGMTDNDITMFNDLVSAKKNLVIALSKADTVTQSQMHHSLVAIRNITGDYPLFPFSSKDGKGVGLLVDAILE